MLKMLVHGYFIYCLFFQTARIFSIPYERCSENQQGFAVYLGTQLFVILTIAVFSLTIGFVSSLIF